jgi:hypothetical protein
MKITELYEGAEPRLPGAVSGIKIMTPQQFAGEANAELNEFAPVGGDDREPNEEEILRQLAAQWWNGTEQQMAKAQNTLAAMGWEIGQDESGDDDAGVFLVRAGDVNGNSYVAFNHSDLDLNEATKLPAQSRELGGQEFQDYMTRIKGTDDIDKKTGQVKVDKKGIAKYTTGKTKTDKYKMPYIHRSSAIEYYDEAGKRFKEEAVIQALEQRPKKLLKQNEKMKHSNGDLEQFFNVGFAALTGVAVDESTGKLIIVNTCPGAGSCKVDCFAMKGGKVQFKAAWLSDGRILTYLLNDPEGFFNQLSAEISKEAQLGKKGGYRVTIRWHDAGDFFSPEYLDLALNMAKKFPEWAVFSDGKLTFGFDVTSASAKAKSLSSQDPEAKAVPVVGFYAYTKMAGAALAQKPSNFIINWSEGANTTQEKQVKQQDPTLASTKNSRIVPDNMFQDLLVKDQKGNLVKGSSGQWQVQPDKLPELKQRLAKQYGISANSILSYDEYMGKGKNTGLKYNVIVAPGEGDVSANDPGVLSTLLLRH